PSASWMTCSPRLVRPNSFKQYIHLRMALTSVERASKSTQLMTNGSARAFATSRDWRYATGSQCWSDVRSETPVRVHVGWQTVFLACSRDRRGFPAVQPRPPGGAAFIRSVTPAGYGVGHFLFTQGAPLRGDPGLCCVTPSG